MRTNNIQITIMGSGGSGKSNLINKLVGEEFSSDSIVEKLNGKQVPHKGVTLTFNENVPNSSSRHGRSPGSQYPGRPYMAIITFNLGAADLEKEEENLKKSIEAWNISVPNTPFIIAFTKSDDTQNSEDKKNACIEHVRYMYDYAAVSSKEGTGIASLMELIFRRVRVEFGLSAIHIPYQYGTTNHKHVTNHRFHMFKADASTIKNRECTLLSDEEKKLTGDQLKRVILEKFQEKLDDALNGASLIKAVDEIKESPEYQIIKTSQGLISKIFGLETDSHKALKDMISQRCSYFEMDEPELVTRVSL